MIGSSHIAQDKCFKQNNTYKISFFILFLNSFHLCKVWVQLPNVLPYNFLVFLFMFNFFWFSELFIFSSKKSSLFFSLNHFSFHYFLFFLNKFIVQLSISAFFFALNKLLPCQQMQNRRQIDFYFLPFIFSHFKCYQEFISQVDSAFFNFKKYFWIAFSLDILENLIFFYQVFSLFWKLFSSFLT